MSYIPTEIIVDIVQRLPVKSLLRFRSVSKPWRALIDSPDFIKSHLNLSLQNQTNTNNILKDINLYSFDTNLLNTAVKLDHPVSRKFIGNKILGSCNGLLCLRDSKNNIFLWNPSTRKHFKLPATNIEYLGGSMNYFDNRIYRIYGFGYDHVNDDYKVVRLIQLLDDTTNLLLSEFKVYSMKSNLWRRIQNFPYCIRFTIDYGDCGTLANGALHWVVNPETDCDVLDITKRTNLIVAFDLLSEEYRLLPPPEFVDKGFDMTIGVFGDCLALNCDYYPHLFDVWLMKEYGVKESWTKLLSIAPHNIRSPAFLMPLAYSNNGVQILFMESERPKTCGDINSFSWYDLEKGRMKTAGIHGAPRDFEQFVESLVQLREKRKHKKKKTRKRDEFFPEGFKSKGLINKRRCY